MPFVANAKSTNHDAADGSCVRSDNSACMWMARTRFDCIVVAHGVWPRVSIVKSRTPCNMSEHISD
eukprot:9493048-Pyramimonas_sp.AAC.1